MKTFGELKVGDIVVHISSGCKRTITQILTSDGNGLSPGYIKLYYNEGWSYFCVPAHCYCHDDGWRGLKDYITPEQNYPIFEQIYRTGYNDGENDIKCKFKNLFDINND